MKYTIAGKTFDLSTIQSPENLMYSSKEDEDFYKSATANQPSHAGFSGTGFDAKGIQIPFSLGYHSIKCMRNLIQKSGFQEGKMLEIGFNLGYSASIWLTLLPNMQLTSVDISNKEETLAAAEAVSKTFPGRFQFICTDSKTISQKVEKGTFGLAFIDGDHSEEGIVADIQNCLDLGIKTMLFDDFLPQFGMTIPALARYQPIELESDGNLALAKF